MQIVLTTEQVDVLRNVIVDAFLKEEQTENSMAFLTSIGTWDIRRFSEESAEPQRKMRILEELGEIVGMDLPATLELRKATEEDK